jgi:hypothetical protein
MSLFSLQNILKLRSRSVSCACQFPEYFFLHTNCTSSDSDLRELHADRELRCGNPRYIMYIIFSVYNDNTSYSSGSITMFYQTTFEYLLCLLISTESDII